MSVVEKAAPRWRLVAIVVGVVAALVATVAVVFTVASGSSPTTDRSATASTTLPSASAASARAATSARTVPIDLRFDLGGGDYRIYLQRTGPANTIYVSAYIDVARGELTYLDETQILYGRVVGRVGDRLVLKSASLRIIDRDFGGAATSIGGDDYVGVWRDNVIVAEYFPERTTYHQYRVDGSEARSVGMVGRRPDVVGGIVGDSVIVERAGRLLRLGLDDAIVHDFGVGHLLGVGGDRIFFTFCTTQGTCTINESTLEGNVRTTPIGNYLPTESDWLFADVAPDGSALHLYDYRHGEDVVLAGGTSVALPVNIDTRSRTWAPTGGWIFSVDEATKKLEAIDYRGRAVLPVPLPKDDTVSLQNVAVW